MNDYRTTRRRLLQAGATAGVIAAAGCVGDDAEPAGYEVWALDQGTDTAYIYEPTDDDGFDLLEEIDFNAFDGVPDEEVVPHMVDFSTDYAYAAIACTLGERTLVLDTETRELVANLETGAGSHFAGFSPDDEYLHVDAIGEGEIVRIDADLDEEHFEVVDAIDVLDDDTVQAAGVDSGAPICHQYAHDGRSLHTLGPSYFDGALVIVDHDDFTVDRAWSGEDLPTNCGTVPHPEEEKFYLTAGLPSDPDADPDEEPVAAEGVGHYYVYDTANDEILVEAGDTGGVDAHGFWFTPDGEELWVLNRETNDGVVIDPDTDEVIDEIDAFGPDTAPAPDGDAPDIMWASPDGEYVFVTLRGPEPLSGDPHAATGENPGFSVLDAETKEIVEVIQPDGDNADSDFHAVGVRVTGEFETDIPSSPPY